MLEATPKLSFVPKRRNRLFAKLFLVFFTVATESYASTAPSLSMGFAAIEEGDTRYRPSVWGSYQWGTNWATGLHFWGRSQAPVLQEQYLLSLRRLFPLFGSSSFHANIGLALSYDRTHIHRSEGEGGKSTAISRNGGLLFGLGWTGSSRLFLDAEWNGTLIPAGYGAIFLATARKQDLSLGMGWRL